MKKFLILFGVLFGPLTVIQQSRAAAPTLQHTLSAAGCGTIKVEDISGVRAFAVPESLVEELPPSYIYAPEEFPLCVNRDEVPQEFKVVVFRTGVPNDVIAGLIGSEAQEIFISGITKGDFKPPFSTLAILSFNINNSLFLQAYVNPCIVRAITSMQGYPLDDFGPFLVEPLSRDFALKHLGFAVWLNDIHFKVLGMSVRSPILHPLPENPLESFQARYPLIVDSMERRLGLSEEGFFPGVKRFLCGLVTKQPPTIKDFFNSCIEEALREGRICIAPEDSELMRTFRARHNFMDKAAGIYFRKRKVILVTASSVIHALTTAIHEGAHAYEDQVLGYPYLVRYPEMFSVFFQHAAIFSALESGHISPNEFLEYVSPIIRSIRQNLATLERCSTAALKFSESESKSFSGLEDIAYCEEDRIPTLDILSIWTQLSSKSDYQLAQAYGFVWCDRIFNGRKIFHSMVDETRKLMIGESEGFRDHFDQESVNSTIAFLKDKFEQVEAFVPATE
ncbi:MAG: hypothetical protein LBI30_02130 [Holosporales bacterium]|jgi:hypothetical protein|nr:hypothetical protein [Holosporales bacterium]